MKLDLRLLFLSQCGNNNELAHHNVPCDRLLQKAYCREPLLNKIFLREAGGWKSEANFFLSSNSQN